MARKNKSSPSQPSRRRRDRKYRPKEPDPTWMERLGSWNEVDPVDWGTPLGSKPTFRLSSEHVKVHERQYRVDQLHEIVPFWRDGVAAAEVGEEGGKWEEFYEKLDERAKNDENSWAVTDDPWGWNVEPGKEGDPPPWDAPADNPWDPPPAWDWGEAAAEPADPQPIVGWGDPSPARSRVSSVKPISQPKVDSWSKPSHNKHRRSNKSSDHRSLKAFVDRLAEDDRTSPERKQLLHKFSIVGTLADLRLFE